MPLEDARIGPCHLTEIHYARLVDPKPCKPGNLGLAFPEAIRVEASHPV